MFVRTFSILPILVFSGLSADGNEPVRVVPPGIVAEARQPQAAVDENGNVYVVYGTANSIYCSVSRDGARTFGKPSKVGETGTLALGMRRGPRVAATKDFVTVTAIGGTIGRGRDGDILSWRSVDGGVNWLGPVKVNDVEDSAREGLHAMALGPKGNLACVWLDLRNHRTEVYGSFSNDGGATWRSNKPIYRSPAGSVCECCHPSVAFDLSGTVYVMWRNQIEGARDMYLTESRDGGDSFSMTVKLGVGTWPLNACPMDGGALAAASGQIWTVWRRNGEIFRASRGKTEELLGTGVQPWTTGGRRGIYSVWISRRPGDLLLLSPDSRVPRTLGTEAVDPVIAGPLTGDSPIVALWESSQGGSPTIFATQIK